MPASLAYYLNDKWIENPILDKNSFTETSSITIDIINYVSYQTSHHKYSRKCICRHVEYSWISTICTSSVTKTINMNNVLNKNKLELHVHNATTDSDRWYAINIMLFCLFGIASIPFNLNFEIEVCQFVIPFRCSLPYIFCCNLFLSLT